MTQRHIAAFLLFAALTIIPFALLIRTIYSHSWEAATTFATLFVGIVAADVVVWQGYLIKRQLAFSTYLDLDKDWNSQEMIEARQAVHAPNTQEWDQSRLEAILEFFEKLASMFKLSGDMPFIHRSTLGWYAAHYFLFAREHGQIKQLRELWQDGLYQDCEEFYASYLVSEVGHSRKARRAWETKRMTTETAFWEQERKD